MQQVPYSAPTNTGFSSNNGMTLNVSNTGLVQYKTVQVAPMGSINNFYFSHKLSPPNSRSKSQRLSVWP